MTYHPFTPATFLGNAGAATIWNLFSGVAGRPLAVGKMSAVYQLVDMPPADEWHTSVDIDGLPAGLVIDAFPFKAMFGADITPADVPGLPPSLADALLTGMIGFVSRALPPPFALVQRRLDAAVGPLPAARLNQGIAVAIEGIAPEPIRFRLALDRNELMPKLGPLLTGAATGGAGFSGSIGVSLAVTLMRLAVTEAGITALTPGSFLLLPAGVEQELNLRLDNRLWRLGAAEGGYGVISAGPAVATDIGLAPTTGGEEGSDALSTEESPAADPGFTLHVDLDIGEVAVSLADLAAWRPGTLVSLNAQRPADGLKVTLAIGGRAVGSGDLVAVEDRFAVRITHLNAPAR